MSNLDLWDDVCETDPHFTKTVNQRGGYTSVSPQYQIREATRKFGAYGMGWGFESIGYDYQFTSENGLVIINAVFFYIMNDKRATFPITNAWPMKNGTRVDPDFAKKAETNTMSKALSKLGFSADVFLGQFDDAEYVNIMEAKARIESGDDEKVEAANKEFKDWFDIQLNSINKCPKASRVKMIVNAIEPKMLDRLRVLKATREVVDSCIAKLHGTADKTISNIK